MNLKKGVLTIALIIAMMILPQVTQAASNNASEAKTVKVESKAKTKIGWVTENGKVRYYLNNTTYVRNSWKQINQNWFYFKNTGFVAKGWQRLGGKTYYLKKSGAVGTVGEMFTGWHKINGNSYYFSKNGALRTGWLKLSGNWYRLKSNGAQGEMGKRLTGWQKISGNKYYLHPKSGKMKTGWHQENGKAYYFHTAKTGSEGVMATGNVKIDGKTWYFNSKGVQTNPPSNAVAVCRKIIYAVETGGQVYGKQRYNDFTEAYHNTPNEHAITIGAGQWYATEAKRLLQLIRSTDKKLFKKLDKQGIGEDIDNADWSSYRISKNSKKAKCIVKIIDSSVGRKCQDKLMDAQIKEFFTQAENLGVKDVGAKIEYVNVAHLGGSAVAKKVVADAKKPYTAKSMHDAIMRRNVGNQVGGQLFRTRHQKVLQWIKKYI